MKEQEINFDSLPKAVGLLFEEVKQIKSLILETSSKEAGDRLLTIQETAEFLHVQKQTLYSYVSKGIIPNHKRAGRLYFSKNELIDWIKSGNKRAFDVEKEAQKIISKRKGGSHE
ncbi:AlpA family transcriptional regulator [Algoriphagus ratkowskyi]|uniref:AlpA family transcriptional regulator n=1 Tax=Algoriphagus ratkowskyi TaxID=57028 RepID=A0A2W7RNW8_9BACT|nr:helix-turn-helix domain-containing protein [Algoriphagus ratkowskyi]PZX52455.1 AlpA family transcriptional regulator [Algoriphagus ratkowskyi]TXD76198.1 helix-turn-helix domain-containing protein [Algoriphagus ratkowskyi]